MKTRMNADEFLSAITREEIKQVLMEQFKTMLLQWLTCLLAIALLKGCASAFSNNLDGNNAPIPDPSLCGGNHDAVHVLAAAALHARS
jgi:uncharacterized lipoprotein YajG